MATPSGYNAYTDPESGRVEYAKPGSELENYLVRDLDWDLVDGSGAESGAVKVSDAAAKLADELDVDLSQVEGTGKGGSITKADVENAAEDASDEDDGGEPDDE